MKLKQGIKLRSLQMDTPSTQKLYPIMYISTYGKFVRMYLIGYYPFYISSLNLCSFLIYNCDIIQKE